MLSPDQPHDLTVPQSLLQLCLSMPSLDELDKILGGSQSLNLRLSPASIPSGLHSSKGSVFHPCLSM